VSRLLHIALAALAALTSQNCAVAETAHGPTAALIPWPEWLSDLPPPYVGPVTSDTKMLIVRPSRALLDMLSSWLIANFELPATDHHPRVELVSRMRLTAMRYRGLASDRSARPATHDRFAGPTGAVQEVYAVYDDEKRTIYLNEDWEGVTPAEISVLVHEIVHHLQNAAGLKFPCPQERERTAYEAQSRWLELFGKNLSDEFDINALWCTQTALAKVRKYPSGKRTHGKQNKDGWVNSCRRVCPRLHSHFCAR
jgi:Domain of unknown function (DUF6647)